MRTKTNIWLTAMTMMLAVESTPAIAQDFTHSTPGIGGYDPVSYFTDGKPHRGSGYPSPTTRV